MTCSGVATAAMFEKHSHVLEHTLQKQHKIQFCSVCMLVYLKELIHATLVMAHTTSNNCCGVCQAFSNFSNGRARDYTAPLTTQAQSRVSEDEKYN